MKALAGASYPVVSDETSEVGTGDSAGSLVGDAEAEAIEVGAGVADGSGMGVDDADAGRGSVSSPHFSPAAPRVRP